MKELNIINEIRKRAGASSKGVKIGIGDDCAVIRSGPGKYLLWATDMLIDGTHFSAGKDGYRKIGRKAVSVNVSDIASMGGVPKYITVALGLPRGFSAGNIRKIYDGVFEICEKYKIDVVGGDTNASGDLIIDISIIGSVEKKRLLTRRGAKKGDIIFVTGPVRDGKKEHLTFVPRLKEARQLTLKYKINAMIDTSDGIATDVSRICSESGKGCVLEEDKIPLSHGLALKDALDYGESFELLFTMSGKEATRFKNNGDMKKLKCFKIGKITDKRAGMRIVGAGGNKKVLVVDGFKHI